MLKKFTGAKNHYDVAPEKLIKEIDKLGLSKTQRNHALSIAVNDMLHPYKARDPLGYVAIPKNYFSVKYGSTYHKVIKALKSSKIIICNESYSTKHKRCKKYKVNPDILSGRLVSTSYVKKYRDKDFAEIEENTLKILKNISIDAAKAEKRLKKYLRTKEYQKGWTFNEGIKEDSFLAVEVDKEGEKFRSWYVKKEDALAYAESKGKICIKDGKNVFICFRDSYEKVKERDIYIHHYRKIKRLEHSIHYSQVNNTNFRLDTTITNFPSIYMEFVKLEGEELINIDIKNSQFFFLSVLLNKNLGLEEEEGNKTQANHKLHNVHHLFSSFEQVPQDEIDCFTDLVENGRLYEYLQDKGGLVSRKAAKLSCFQTLFSSHRFRGGLTHVFKSAFPAIYTSINAFKKSQGSRSFPILLQKVESHVMINNVLRDLLSEGFSVLTKHDSVLCKKSDFDRVMARVQGKLSDMGLNPLLSVEKP